MYEVVLAPEARDFYAMVDQPLAKKLARCFTQLEKDPRQHNNIKRLKHEFAGLYRYRVGDWRVVYKIDDKLNQVAVLSIAHRREIYD